MKKLIISIIILLFLHCLALAQTLSIPTKIPVKPTAQQQLLIDEGNAYSQKGKFDKAIEKYQQVIKENPDCVEAIYGLMTNYYYYNFNLKKTSDMAHLGFQYKSSKFFAFCDFFGSTLGWKGKTDEAIEVFQYGINVLKEARINDSLTSWLYGKLGAIYLQQKRYNEATEACKRSIEGDLITMEAKSQDSFVEGSSSQAKYSLMQIFDTRGYKIQANLVAIQVISETGPQNLPVNFKFNGLTIKWDLVPDLASITIEKFLARNIRDGYEKKSVSFLVDSNNLKDEGDFSESYTTDNIDSEDTSKADVDRFILKMNNFISFVETNAKKNESTFIGKNFIPFILEMKKKGFVKTFSYIVLQRLRNKEAQQWVGLNNGKVQEMMSWAREYKP